MSLISQGVLVNYPKYTTPDACTLNPIPSSQDTTPGYTLLASATLGTFWWLFQWFIYIENSTPLQNTAGQGTVPIGWFWWSLGNTRYGWTAASYFAAFFIYALVSVIEFIAWFFYIGGATGWFGWWVASFGWWGSVLGLILPWLFAVFQLSFPTTSGGLPSINSDFGANAVFLIVINLTMWVINTVLHVIMTPRLLCHINSKPLVIKTCPLRRKVGMPEAEYQAACKKIFAAVAAKKAQEEAEAAAADAGEPAAAAAPEEEGEF